MFKLAWSLTRYFFALAWCASVPVWADPLPNTTTVDVQWASLGGKAVDLSVGIDGSVFALDPEGHVWLRRPSASASKQGWRALPGNFQRIDAHTEKDAWALDANGQAFRFQGSYWQAIQSEPLKDIAAGEMSQAYAVSQTGELLHFSAASTAFEKITGTPSSLMRLDVDALNQPWVIDTRGRLYRASGKSWVAFAENLQDISVGANDTAMAIKSNGMSGLWLTQSRQWQDLAVHASAVAVGADGRPWVAHPDGGIFAQYPDGRQRLKAVQPSRDVFLQVMDWRRINGAAKALTIAATGQVMALGTEGRAWLRQASGTWTQLPGQFIKLTMHPNGDPWALDKEGRILRFSGVQWLEVGGKATELSAGSNGAVWALLPNGQLAAWQPGARAWQAIDMQIPSPWKSLRGLAVDSGGWPWISNQHGQVHRFDGNKWFTVSGVSADSLAAGPDGSVFALSSGQIFRYSRLEKRWQRVAGEAKAIAVGPKGMPWIANIKLEIFASALFDKPQSPADSSPVNQATTQQTSAPAILTAATSKEPLNTSSFRQVVQVAARDISIGNQGSVFALAFDGSMIRWNNGQQKFLSYPGQFKRIATAPDGQPWGITTSGEVWRHNRNGWGRVTSVVAQDIDIGADGTVLIAATDNTLHRFNTRTDLFEREQQLSPNGVPPMGVKVAVDPQGHAWTLDQRQQIRKCNSEGCDVLPQLAIDIDIGPEGSVFIVAPDYRLYRLDAAFEKWEPIGIEAESVSVGPAGKPWIVNSRNEVWYSALFPRNEGQDIADAAVNAQQSNSTNIPVFSFSINLPFDTIPLPAGLGAGGFNMAELPSGKVVVFDKSLGFWVYDPSAKQWRQDTSIPSAAGLLGADRVRSFQITPDGSFWLSNTGNSPNTPQVWRRSPGGAWQSVAGLADGPDCDAGTPPPSNSLSQAPDGTLYATTRGCNLYRYDATFQRFMAMQNLPKAPGGAGYVTIDASGKFWVGTYNFGIYEFSGNNWIKRSQSPRVFAIFQCLHWELPCVAAGANGTVFSTDEGAARRLTRWNPNGGSWDTVTSSPAFVVTYLITRDGRPWVWDGVSLRRAR